MRFDSLTLMKGDERVELAEEGANGFLFFLAERDGELRI